MISHGKDDDDAVFLDPVIQPDLQFATETTRTHSPSLLPPDEDPDTIYAFTGQIFSGKVPRRQDWKAFAWFQDGDRRLRIGDADGKKENMDRKRWGLGATFRKGKLRAVAEWYWADGMIFAGTDGGAVPRAYDNAGSRKASFNVLPDQKANGGYFDIGYRILPKVELDYRFGYLDRANKSPDSQNREFTDHKLGIQYFFNKKARAIFNYQFRKGKAKDNDVADDNLNKMDNLLSAQVLMVF